jgi:hypothetical protein
MLAVLEEMRRRHKDGGDIPNPPISERFHHGVGQGQDTARRAVARSTMTSYAGYYAALSAALIIFFWTAL